MERIKAKHYVGVFCSADDKIPDQYKEQAQILGTTLSQNGYHLVTGGSCTGLMNAVTNGFFSQGDSRGIQGVIPVVFKEYNIHHPKIPQENLIWTDNIYHRLQTFQNICTTVIILPGGFGTLHELMDFLVSKQIGMINKNIILVNINNFWDHLLNQFNIMVRNNALPKEHLDILTIVNNIPECIKHIQISERQNNGLKNRFWENKNKKKPIKMQNNLIFKSENLEALKALNSSYSNSIKCIYIDPPYNTGFNREHYNDTLSSNDWVKMMEDRLILMHSLLTEDGSIWISIDDCEVHNLKIILNKVFGKENYLATITWQHKINWKDYQGKFQIDHTYIVSFQKSNKFKFSNNQKPKTVWLENETGGQAEAIEESLRIFGVGNAFCTPKPEKLIRTILELTTNPGDIVLDCFAGSGTTGAAAQTLQRRWILIEMGEQCETHILKRMHQISSEIDANDKYQKSYNHFRYFNNLEDYITHQERSSIK